MALPEADRSVAGDAIVMEGYGPEWVHGYFHWNEETGDLHVDKLIDDIEGRAYTFKNWVDGWRSRGKKVTRDIMLLEMCIAYISGDGVPSRVAQSFEEAWEGMRVDAQSKLVGAGSSPDKREVL